MRIRVGLTALTITALTAASMLAAPLAASAAPARPVVTMHVDASILEVGDTVTVTGVVSHVPLSTTVQIQRYARHAWHRVQVGFAGGKGEFVVTFIAGGLGREPLRAAVAATTTHAAATSVTRTVTVRDWFPLADAQPTARTGAVTLGAASVNGVAHLHTVVFAPGRTNLHPTATWDLDGRCTEFRSNVLWDEATPGTDGLRVLADGVSRVRSVVHTVDGVATDLHRTRSLRLETDGVKGVANQRAAWVDAEVLCTADPADV